MLECKISKEVEKLCLERIGEVEQSLRPMARNFTPAITPNSGPALHQAPSTIALMEKHGIPIPEPTTPGIAATNPITAQAIASRAAMMAQAASGVEDRGRTSPRKY